MLKIKLIILISLCLILFLTNKCTLAGLGVGSIINQEKSKFQVNIYEKLNSVSPGTKLNLISTVGDTISGK